MVDELIDILDKTGNPIGETRLKSEVHALGLFHASVHIWFYTHDGKILFQRRSKQKDTFPNLWDISVAGHITAGESALESAIREVQEEIGFTVADEKLEFISMYLSEKKPKPKFYDNEFQHIYISEFDIPLTSLKLQKEEVSGLSLIDIHHIELILKDPDRLKYFVPHDPLYYDLVFKEIQNRLR